VWLLAVLGFSVVCLVSWRLSYLRLLEQGGPNSIATPKQISVLEAGAHDRETPCEKAAERLLESECVWQFSCQTTGAIFFLPYNLDANCAVNIRLVALDFDYTITDIHTGGQWRSSAHELALHVRPEMKCLITKSIRKGLFCAVTSFSKQEQLIKEVMGEAIPLAKNTTVVGGRNRSEEQGKRKQLKAAMDSYRNDVSSLAPSTTILIDDDTYNIRRARDDGYYAIWFNPDNAGDLFEAILTLLPH
jgi:hypothetical protein